MYHKGGKEKFGSSGNNPYMYPGRDGVPGSNLDQENADRFLLVGFVGAFRPISA
jgi:hypothetical protein